MKEICLTQIYNVEVKKETECLIASEWFDSIQSGTLKY